MYANLEQRENRYRGCSREYVVMNSLQVGCCVDGGNKLSPLQDPIVGPGMTGGESCVRYYHSTIHWR